MRLSRSNYDKIRRCPGWSGGAFTWPDASRCDDGHVYQGEPGEWPSNQWWFGRCDTCDVVTWPQITRWLDWSWVSWAVPRNIRHWREDRYWRQRTRRIRRARRREVRRQRRAELRE